MREEKKSRNYGCHRIPAEKTYADIFAHNIRRKEAKVKSNFAPEEGGLHG